MLQSYCISCWNHTAQQHVSIMQIKLASCCNHAASQYGHHTAIILETYCINYVNKAAFMLQSYCYHASLLALYAVSMLNSGCSAAYMLLSCCIQAVMQHILNTHCNDTAFMLEIIPFFRICLPCYPTYFS